jgi:plastocyanin
VDESTAVPEEAETTFEVTLEAGEYTYKCDPHPPMTGSFTVT